MTTPSPCAGGLAGTLLLPMLAHKLLAATVVVPGASAWGRLFVDDFAAAALLALAGLGLGPRGRMLVGVGVLAWLVLAQLSVQALGMPFLPTMLAGCDAAMQDSLWPYATFGNALRVATLVAAMLAGRAMDDRLRLRPRWLVCGAVVAVGVQWAGQPPAHPCHRNPLLAFVRQLVPRSAVAMPVVRDGVRLQAMAPVAPTGLARGRSVVLVVLESARQGLVEPAEDEAPAMPFLRELAAGGLHCPTAYAVYPESIEGQVPILCALPPRVDAAPADYVVAASEALPHRLRPYGYRSGLFHAGRFAFLGMQEVLAPMGFDVLADAAAIRGVEESSFGIDEAATVDALVHWVAQQPRDQAVLACWLPIAGHHPYASPPGGPFPATSPYDCWRNAQHHADQALRRLWLALCTLRPPEQWLLCVVGDHGQAFGEHAGNFGHSFELYEENLRVPLVFVAPGSSLAGTRHEAPCSHLDVVPTLLDLLGLPSERSLLRTSADAVHAFTDWGELLVMRREGRWKLVHEVATGRDRLFDLANDPLERVDLAPGAGERCAALRAGALAFLVGCGARVRH
ncbi:MAG: sulfatase-like hydrolase/transferase [Planctomycetes bacterium]|nr:sulfatase-like hydrolase/transferase [Planctomycetota bacterium]